jgi:N-acetylglucosamine-6-phosphate deacetylase
VKTRQIRARHYATRQAVLVRWEAGRITQCEPAPDAPGAPWWIAPGLLDAQVNGFGNVDFQAETIDLEALLKATRALRAAGCTRYLLTLITDQWDRLTAKLRRLRELRAQSAELQAAIAGWHLEGPFLSAEPGYHGTHDPALMLDPTPDHIHQLRALTPGDALLLTVAPERSGALAAIRLAASLGARVSLGHTNASRQLLAEAFAAGATGFTHLGNACPQALDRHDNVLWRVFETPGLMTSLIPDGIHVSPPLFRLVHRVLSLDSIFYVTDAMAAAGAPPGRYALGRMQVDVGPDQVVRAPGQTHYAGSALRPIDGVFRAAEMLGVSWQETWRRFSFAPAEWLGLPCSLAPGQRADFCLLKVSAQGRLTDLRVFFGGREAPRRGAASDRAGAGVNNHRLCSE